MLGPFATGVHNQCMSDIYLYTVVDIRCPPNPFIYFGIENFTIGMNSH